MPKVKANNLTINYDQQGTGEPLILIPYSPPITPVTPFRSPSTPSTSPASRSIRAERGRATSPSGTYSTELFADDVAAFMDALGIQQAHVSGLSLGAATGMWLAAKYPGKVKSLSLHSPWTRTDAFLKAVVEGWQVMAGRRKTWRS